VTDEYTPNDAVVRDAYLYVYKEDDEDPTVVPERSLEFERWIAQHDREVAAQALREAANTATSHIWQPGDAPYRNMSVEQQGAYMWGANDAHDIVDRLLRDRADQLEGGTAK
jgi:hypothetical protein